MVVERKRYNHLQKLGIAVVKCQQSSTFPHIDVKNHALPLVFKAG